MLWRYLNGQVILIDHPWISSRYQVHLYFCVYNIMVVAAMAMCGEYNGELRVKVTRYFFDIGNLSAEC
ncbi:hypothetical protein EV363DRAFT_1210524 [Boletus edulis]|uniref:Uncharacterized protein n=1 Tax=Boletus edulis BED1 TaxID=1328754 RepID=A0AAD4BQZ3_BOLED|nr:hypothetical protein EV363DRAFT_1210524 [Boletus edulis]KAF8437993.1 hypothetical protein L210DRAFT_221209 [Boletus edulis BED1]